jgi:fascin 1/2
MPGTSVCSVNGSNGSNGTTTSATDKGCWTVGLINSKFKYLSAETFGFRINANGKSLKKKQIWVLEPSGDGESVVLRSHLNKFIAVDQFGNVTCDQVKYS